jgi:hypothetical protein
LKNLEAELNPVDGTIALISPVTNARRIFKRIDAGVAWGNPKSDEPIYSEHACVLVGLQDDDRINVLREFRGRMTEIIDKLIEWKDVLFLRNIHAPAEPLGLWRLLQDADGLTRYVVVKRDKDGRGCEPRGDILERHPTFRSLEYTASLRKIPETVLGDVFGAHTLVDELIRKEEILVDLRYCHEIEKNANQPLNEVIESSVNKAMLWGINALWREALNEGFTPNPPKKVKAPWKQFVRRK